MRSYYLEWFVWVIIVFVVIMYWKLMGYIFFYIYDEIMFIGVYVLKDEFLCFVWNLDDSVTVVYSMKEKGRREWYGSGAGFEIDVCWRSFYEFMCEDNIFYCFFCL